MCLPWTFTLKAVDPGASEVEATVGQGNLAGRQGRKGLNWRHAEERAGLAACRDDGPTPNPSPGIRMHEGESIVDNIIGIENQKLSSILY